MSNGNNNKPLPHEQTVDQMAEAAERYQPTAVERLLTEATIRKQLQDEKKGMYRE